MIKQKNDENQSLSLRSNWQQYFSTGTVALQQQWTVQVQLCYSFWNPYGSRVHGYDTAADNFYTGNLKGQLPFEV